MNQIKIFTFAKCREMEKNSMGVNNGELLNALSINLQVFYHECRSLIGYATRYLFCVSINLLVFYHECRSLIGYATRYLFCDR